MADWGAIKEGYPKTVSSIEEAKLMIEDHEYDTCTSYSEVKSSKDFGKFDITKGSHFIRFSDDNKRVQIGSRIPSTGEAFIITGSRLLECHQGPDHRRLSRGISADENTTNDHTYQQAARKKKVTGTKKLGCSASILLREVVFFPEYKPSKNTHYCRDACSLRLRTDMESALYDEIKMVKLIYISLPRLDDHFGHIMGDAADLKAPVDDRVNEHIKKLVSENVTNTNEISRHIKIFVKGIFGNNLPQNLNRRFYPSREDIRKIVYREKKRLMEGKLDQERLKEKVKEWTSENTGNIVYFRPSGENESDEGESQFLLFFQTDWQRRLLSRYGNELVFLDATYRTTRYALPLFFLCVYTNCGYYIVATIITENEDAASLVEAFERMKEANEQFHPTAFMIDSSEIEMNAIRMAFPESNIFLCDFHRKQAWVRWTNASKNGVLDCKEKVLSMLNNLAEAISEDEFNERLTELRESVIWNSNERLRNYFERQWLPKHQSWVWAYRGSWLTLVINTNNGVEAQNKVFKYEYLTAYKDSTVTRLMQCLVDEYFVDLYRKYLTANITMSSGWRTPAEHIPLDLKHKPLHLLQHMKDVDIKALSIPAHEVTRVDDLSFLVTSGSVIYPICLGNESTMPSCTCRSFRRTHMPCKHFGAIFRHYDDVSFSSLPDIYTGNPIFTLDNDLFDQMGIPPPGFAKEENLISDYVQDEAALTDTIQQELISDTGCLLPGHDAAGKKVREAVSTIHGLSFLVDSTTCLKDVKIELDTIISKMKIACPNSGGLILEKTEVKRKSVKDPLPMRKRRKQRQSKEEDKTDVTPMKLSLRGRKKTKQRSVKEDKTGVTPMKLSPRGRKKTKQMSVKEDSIMAEKAKKKVRWSDQIEDYITFNSDIDSQKARNMVDRIWAWPEGTGYITARVFKFNVTDTDIRSLDQGEWLTDQVIDAYLAHLAQAEIDKGRKVKQEATSTMTSIVKGEHKPKNGKYRVYEYEVILGAYLQGGHHWDLVVIEPKKRVLSFYNPMGETVFQQRQVLTNWKNFLDQTLNDRNDWKLDTPDHSKQIDSFNCGVYTLMFAEYHLLGIPCFFEQSDVSRKRKEVAATLLLYEANVQDCCPCCGYGIDTDEEVMYCGMCEKKFHKKAYCVGQYVVDSESDAWMCRRCHFNVAEN